MVQREQINPGWERFEQYTFAPAVRCGNMLFMSGMTAVDESGSIVGEEDIVTQTAFIYEKMSEVLEAAGASFDDIVYTREYITSTDEYRETAAVRREYFQNGFPAATGVVVADLLRPNALIEIEAMAVLGSVAAN